MTHTGNRPACVAIKGRGRVLPIRLHVRFPAKPPGAARFLSRIGELLRPIANALTLARLLAVLPFTVLLATAEDGRSLPAAAIFTIASLTDFLDGVLARRAHEPSQFGRIADPLADRLLINMAMILLWYAGRLPWWLALPVLTRDVWLMALFHKRHAETRIAVNYAGKWATALIMLSLALLMATSESWPLAIFALGTAVSLVAGALYSLKPREVA
jgi:CDP-diacylglycerol--glycerol-3-phosphate 3-phosphatidyltransferase